MAAGRELLLLWGDRAAMTHHVDRLKNGLCLVTLLSVMAIKRSALG